MSFESPDMVNDDSRRWVPGSYRQLRYLSQPAILEEIGPPRIVRVMLLLLTTTVFGFLVWASLTTLKETTRSTGEIVPTGSVMAIQHLEGGIVSAIFVRDGDIVEPDQILVRLDPTSAMAQLEEMQAHAAAQTIREKRLRAFARGHEPEFGAIPDRYAELAGSEMAIFRQQSEALQNDRQVLAAQADQRVSEMQVLRSKAGSLRKRIEIFAEQKRIQEAMLQTGLVSRVVYLQTLEQYQSAVSELTETAGKIERAQGAIEEFSRKIAQVESMRRNEALEEAGKVAGDLASTREAITRLRDRVQRLDIRAPVRGIVKGLATRTIGGVIAPGGVVTEIVPADKELIVEARISPVDIGHVSVGQKATVKITTFDFARFGSVDGEVRKISATTFKDRENEIYYKAEVALARMYVGDDPAKNHILPGMIAEIDINTGERTILRYLLRPVFQSLDIAFSER